LAIVVITTAFRLTMALLMASAVIPQAQAFQRPFGEPPGLHKIVTKALASNQLLPNQPIQIQSVNPVEIEPSR
jgi:hypothetical protein